MKYKVTLNGKIYEVEVEETEAVITNVADYVPAQPAAAPAEPAAAKPAGNASVMDGTKIVAPMPGAIVSINVSVGQAVKTGDILLVLEAMKMENDIVSPADGSVKQILVQKGEMVDTDAVMLVIG